MVWTDVTETGRSFAKDVCPQAPDFTGFRISGILTQVFCREFQNVADDRNTRDYLASVASRYFATCAAAYDTQHNEILGMYYVFFYETRSQNKIFQNLADINSMARHEAVMFQTGLTSGGHLLDEGTADGNQLLRKGCDEPAAKQLFQNMMEIFADRNSMPPDVPANAFFRLQMSTPVEQPNLPFTNAESYMMRSIRKSCERAMPILDARQEMFCRCEPVSLVQAKVPAAEWQDLSSKFETAKLDSIAGRYPGYALLRETV